MTYCLGILLPSGLLMASDSRSNAGVDQIASVRKLALFAVPGDRVIALCSAGNLATTQAVVSLLRQNMGSGIVGRDLAGVPTMFDAAQGVASVLRDVLARDGDYVRPYGDPTGTFLVGGQISGETHRLFEIYAATNFVEATPRKRFLQTGETKYGKPILDRALREDTTMGDAAKLALLSFDATIRSNLSVAPPIDMLCYETGSLAVTHVRKYSERDAYLTELRQRYSHGLLELVDGLPPPPEPPPDEVARTAE